MKYVVWMDGHKVRMFDDKFWTYERIERWVELYCHSENISIDILREYDSLPRAMKLKWCPNLDMPELRHKPFVSLT